MSQTTGQASRQPAIESFALEERTFEPPEDFRADALVADRSLY